MKTYTAVEVQRQTFLICTSWEVSYRRHDPAAETSDKNLHIPGERGKWVGQYAVVVALMKLGSAFSLTLTTIVS